jgi:hypothetical protein
MAAAAALAARVASSSRRSLLSSALQVLRAWGSTFVRSGAKTFRTNALSCSMLSAACFWMWSLAHAMQTFSRFKASSSSCQGTRPSSEGVSSSESAIGAAYNGIYAENLAKFS